MPMSSETRLSQVSTYLELGVGSHHRQTKEQTSPDDISPLPAPQALQSLCKLVHLNPQLQQAVIIKKNRPFVGVALLEIQQMVKLQESHSQAE